MHLVLEKRRRNAKAYRFTNMCALYVLLEKYWKRKYEDEAIVLWRWQRIVTVVGYAGGVN